MEAAPGLGVYRLLRPSDIDGSRYVAGGGSHSLRMESRPDVIDLRDGAAGRPDHQSHLHVVRASYRPAR